MNRLTTHRYVATLVVLLALLSSTAAFAITNQYSDGCTICDFYDAEDRWVGYVEWCH